MANQTAWMASKRLVRKLDANMTGERAHRDTWSHKKMKKKRKKTLVKDFEDFRMRRWRRSMR